MRKILFLSLFFALILSPKGGWCDDNILALDAPHNKEKILLHPEKEVRKMEDSPNVASQDKALADESSTIELEKMKAYRETLESKENELEMIKLDLEKSSLLLKKKETEKEIHEIDKILPREGASQDGSSSGGEKEEAVDPSDIKIKLLAIGGDMKEGQILLKGVPYSFREGDGLPFKLTVEKIERGGITLRDSRGEVLKLNFIN